jgi:hypothetical protein
MTFSLAHQKSRRQRHIRSNGFHRMEVDLFSTGAVGLMADSFAARILKTSTLKVHTLFNCRLPDGLAAQLVPRETVIFFQECGAKHLGRSEPKKPSNFECWVNLHCARAKKVAGQTTLPLDLVAR